MPHACIANSFTRLPPGIVFDATWRSQPVHMNLAKPF